MTGLRYHETGSGEPLVTVPALAGPALDTLALSFRVIGVEPAGDAAALDALTADLGLERYHLLGTSAGGPVALRLALRAPGRVRSLILAAPAGEPDAAGLAGCGTRTLVLFGTRDEVMAPETGRAYRRLMPNCTLQYVYDAGHDIAQDRPAAFADVTGDFLRRGLQFLIPDQDTLINP